MMTANEYLDLIMERNKLRRDVQLARLVDIQAPLISKLRNGHIALTPFIMLRLHEKLGCSIAEMRDLIHEDEFSIEARAAGVERIVAPVVD